MYLQLIKLENMLIIVQVGQTLCRVESLSEFCFLKSACIFACVFQLKRKTALCISFAGLFFVFEK